MSTLKPSRKLTAILPLDVVDFGMLMGETKVGHFRINSIVTGRYFESNLAVFRSKIFQV